jgi:hypothetical protein
MVSHGALVHKKLVGYDFSGLSGPETETCEFIVALFLSGANQEGLEMV